MADQYRIVITGYGSSSEALGRVQNLAGELHREGHTNVIVQEEPAPGTGGATPGGVGLGSGNATGGGEGGGG